VPAIEGGEGGCLMRDEEKGRAVCRLVFDGELGAYVGWCWLV
jgi:hypothetical protein